MNAPSRIVFIGAPMAGKSCLMAAWYHFCEQVYHIEINKADPDNQHLLSLVDSINRHEGIQRTSPGDGFRPSFGCCDPKTGRRALDLVLCDYSGESVCDRFNEVVLHGDGEEEREDPIVRDVRGADLIILVCDPATIANGAPGAQHEALMLLKLLTRAGSRREELLTRTHIYFSRADVTSPDLVDQARQIILAGLAEMGVAAHDRLRIGAAVVQQADGRIGLAPDDHPHTPKAFVIQEMTTLAAQNDRPPKSQRKLLAVCIFSLALMPLLWMAWPEQPDREPWELHQRTLTDIEQKAKLPIDYSRARNVIKELEQWEQTAKTQHSREYDGSSLVAKVGDLRSKLEAIPAPKELDAVRAVVVDLKNRHGLDLRVFYERLKDAAAQGKSDMGYSGVARAEWGRVEVYCAQLLQGVHIGFGESWLRTGRFWVWGTGSGSVQIELWIASAGAPQPFDRDTEHTDKNPKATLATAGADATGPTDGKYNYRWQSSGVAGRPLQLGDQIWVRVFFWGGWKDNVELASFPVKLEGPDQLGWFNQRQTLHISGAGEAECLIRVYCEPSLEVPATIRQAF